VVDVRFYEGLKLFGEDAAVRGGGGPQVYVCVWGGEGRRAGGRESWTAMA
jgi:hypothetical protein